MCAGDAWIQLIAAATAAAPPRFAAGGCLHFVACVFVLFYVLVFTNPPRPLASGRVDPTVQPRILPILLTLLTIYQ